MGAKTGIEWCDSTWNPIRGCSRVSEGCRHCYAESVAARFSKPGLAYEGLAVMQNGKPHWTGKIEFVEKHLLDPLKWGPMVEHRGPPPLEYGCENPRKCDCPRRPRRIFVNSMSDLFHENVTDEMRDKIFAVMALCPQHVFQVLTKRPKRMLEYMNSDRDGWTCKQKIAGAVLSISNALAMKAGTHKARISMDHFKNCFPSGGGVFPNVWLGVSVENQQTADERIPLLLQTPAAVRFISAEPLLGAIDLVAMENTVCRFNPLPAGYEKAVVFYLDCLRGCRACALENCDSRQEEDGWIPKIDWVICGGESGPGARPMHPDWARGLRDQCQDAGVPFFFKQWGEYIDGFNMNDCDASKFLCNVAANHEWPEPTKYLSYRVGKHAAGSLLDGKEWKQFPEVRHA